jgi:hypothetical protein
MLFSLTLSSRQPKVASCGLPNFCFPIFYFFKNKTLVMFFDSVWVADLKQVIRPENKGAKNQQKVSPL